MSQLRARAPTPSSSIHSASSDRAGSRSAATRGHGSSLSSRPHSDPHRAARPSTASSGQPCGAGVGDQRRRVACAAPATVGADLGADARRREQRGRCGAAARRRDLDGASTRARPCPLRRRRSERAARTSRSAPPPARRERDDRLAPRPRAASTQREVAAERVADEVRRARTPASSMHAARRARRRSKSPVQRRPAEVARERRREHVVVAPRYGRTRSHVCGESMNPCRQDDHSERTSAPVGVNGTRQDLGPALGELAAGARRRRRWTRSRTTRARSGRRRRSSRRARPGRFALWTSSHERG